MRGLVKWMPDDKERDKVVFGVLALCLALVLVGLALLVRR